MGKQMGNLTALGAKTKTPGVHGDGDGLQLIVGANGSAKWQYRFSFAGRIRQMGLGARKDVSLAEARQKRDEARKLVLAGVDPIADRKTQRVRGATFGEIAEKVLAKKAVEAKNQIHVDQWNMTLRVYAKRLWGVPLEDLTTADVLACLTPIWKKTPETANRTRGRIEAVIDAGRALGAFPPDRLNPAAWQGNLKSILPTRAKLSKKHHAAMAYAEVGAFVRRLRERKDVTARALEVTILTATRTGEVLNAKWPEIDFEQATWTVPAVRMKAGVAHTIPLSKRVVEIFRQLRDASESEWVFPGAVAGKPLSQMAMLSSLRKMPDIGKPTVHGFRSSFRDWAGDISTFPREVCEAALAHTLPNVEASYRRSDALAKRRQLMDAWANYLDDEVGGNVVRLEPKATRRAG
jgi:integrase